MACNLVRTVQMAAAQWAGVAPRNHSEPRSGAGR
jgi:hypothetical protein